MKQEVFSTEKIILFHLEEKLDWKFSINELKEAPLSIKNVTTPKPDNLPNEIIKTALKVNEDVSLHIETIF